MCLQVSHSLIMWNLDVVLDEFIIPVAGICTGENYAQK
jgi:hypothetical protein